MFTIIISRLSFLGPIAVASVPLSQCRCLPRPPRPLSWTFCVRDADVKIDMAEYGWEGIGLAPNIMMGHYIGAQVNSFGKWALFRLIVQMFTYRSGRTKL